MLEVRRLREERGWKQTELAFHAGLTPSVISQIENGKRDPSARTMRKLAEGLGVEVADLFPKAEAPLWSGETLERRPSLAARAISAAADKWRADVPRTDVTDGEISGRVEAALDLYEFFAKRVEGEERDALTREELDELIAVTDKLAIACADGMLRLHKSGYLDDHIGGTFEQRREKMREWTRRISA